MVSSFPSAIPSHTRECICGQVAREDRSVLQKAGETFGDLITWAHELQDGRFEAWGAIGEGDVLGAQGDRPGALAVYQVALAIRESLA
jgi:hypothetical protein